MRTKITLMSIIIIILLSARSMALANSALQLKVITSSQDGFWVNSTLVYGEKEAILRDNPSSLNLTKDYLIFYDEALASSKTKEEFMTKVKDKFPDLGLEVILKLGSDAAFSMESKN